jgi:nucleotide-binding universal stress UspA family protein
MPVIDQRAEIAIQTVLLATDFSSVSERAAVYAKALARRFHSTVELTHVIDLSGVGSSETTPVGISVDEMRRESEEGLERLSESFSGVKTKTRMLEAFSPPDELLKLAKDSGADLIVIGTSSKHGLEKLVLGSTAETIIRKATCPVLTVGPCAAPPPQDPLAFRTIVYATDFSAQAAKAAIYALSFAQDSGAHLYLCHVLGVRKPRHSEKLVLENSFERSLKRLIPPSAYDWCNPECVVVHGDSAEAILELAERVDADLIVLGARKASFWLKYIESGLTPAILAGAKCPVLTVC